MNFVLPLPPLGTNDGYHTNKGRWFKDPKVKRWEEECLWLLKGKVKAVKRDGVGVNIGFYYPDKLRRDIDGRIKFVLDLFTKAGAYKDDSLVTDLIVAKRLDKNHPRLEVEIY